ncbi:MAG: hypothetical protein ACQXXH_01995 [Candidatus Bathyarchaeia archaeon]|nr:hypothetical protein [Candidatus Bathyarchaeota archaeon A05DMB-4]MDH7594517.1 hypothetical protein [Candidatus Bathyarchaeota archaeon]
MGTADTEDGGSLRTFVLFLFPSILFIGIAAVYYIVEQSNWGQLDTTLAAALKIFYIYATLLGICLFAALAWLVVDERKIRRLTKLLKNNKDDEQA